jgi:hypothetical protein
VQVDRGNFRVVAVDISASVNSKSILCMIPGGMEPLTRRLMKQLHTRANLRKNQMFINFRQDYSLRSLLFFICTYEHTLTADVIEFDRNETETTSGNQQPGGDTRLEEADSEMKPDAKGSERNPAKHQSVKNVPVTRVKPAPVVVEKSEEPLTSPSKPGVLAPSEAVIPGEPESDAAEKPGPVKKPKPKKKAKQVLEEDPVR